MNERNPKIKICGITNLKDAHYASEKNVDYLGFIFYKNSPRYINPKTAIELINKLDGPKKVGVFVNQSIEEVNQIAKEANLDLVQLHGNESVEYCELINKPIIKVLHVTPNTSAEKLKNQIEGYTGIVKYVLFDTKIDGLWGGTGKTFDWKVLSELWNKTPYFVAGGLNSDNVQNAIINTSAFAVDVSSSLEKTHGIKDFNKIDALMDVMESIWRKQS